MAPLWFVPTIVLTVGAGASAWLLKRIADASGEVRSTARRLERLQPALVPVRTDTERARAAIDRLNRR